MMNEERMYFLRRVVYKHNQFETPDGMRYQITLELVRDRFHFWEYISPVTINRTFSIFIPTFSTNDVDHQKMIRLKNLKEFFYAHMTYHIGKVQFFYDALEELQNFFFSFQHALDWCLDEKTIKFCDNNMLAFQAFNDADNDKFQILLSVNLQIKKQDIELTYIELTFPYKARGKDGEIKNGCIKFGALTNCSQALINSIEFSTLSGTVGEIINLLEKDRGLRTELVNRIANAEGKIGWILVKALPKDDNEYIHFDPKAYERFLEENRAKLIQETEFQLYNLSEPAPR